MLLVYLLLKNKQTNKQKKQGEYLLSELILWFLPEAKKKNFEKIETHHQGVAVLFSVCVLTL